MSNVGARLTESSDLIETYWDVKNKTSNTTHMWLARFNRNILGCKEMGQERTKR